MGSSFREGREGAKRAFHLGGRGRVHRGVDCPCFLGQGGVLALSWGGGRCARPAWEDLAKYVIMNSLIT